jgi:hypothetical protein
MAASAETITSKTALCRMGYAAQLPRVAALALGPATTPVARTTFVDSCIGRYRSWNGEPAGSIRSWSRLNRFLHVLRYNDVNLFQ